MSSKVGRVVNNGTVILKGRSTDILKPTAEPSIGPARPPGKPAEEELGEGPSRAPSRNGLISRNAQLQSRQRIQLPIPCQRGDKNNLSHFTRDLLAILTGCISVRNPIRNYKEPWYNGHLPLSAWLGSGLTIDSFNDLP